MICPCKHCLKPESLWALRGSGATCYILGRDLPNARARAAYDAPHFKPETALKVVPVTWEEP